LGKHRPGTALIQTWAPPGLEKGERAGVAGRAGGGNGSRWCPVITNHRPIPARLPPRRPNIPRTHRLWPHRGPQRRGRRRRGAFQHDRTRRPPPQQRRAHGCCAGIHSRPNRCHGGSLRSGRGSQRRRMRRWRAAPPRQRRSTQTRQRRPAARRDHRKDRLPHQVVRQPGRSSRRHWRHQGPSCTRATAWRHAARPQRAYTARR
jgi:hypothetical protein